MPDELSHKNLDPVKKYAQPVPLKHGSWRCNYCHKVTNGGVKGAKQHILGGFRNVTQCSLVPPIMREKIKDSMLKKTEIKATTQMMPPPATSYDDYGEEEEAAEVLGNEKRQPPVKKQKGLMDMFVCPTLPNVLKVLKDANMLYDHLDRMVDEVGEANVVKVVTDNASNYVKASQLSMANRPHLYWTPCAAHCIDLMLEDIGKISEVKTVITQCIFKNDYIYGHTSLVNMMRKNHKRWKSAKIGCNTVCYVFHTIGQYHKQRKNLRNSATSQEWADSKWQKEIGARTVKRIIMQDSFWHKDG
ncbi:unnamed protein product [Arabidopsis thaliana]|uniref:DUF659 domain-containing protein n=1 Tax=Arabidopsis thaliana TaxID=3702 RepID=A0A654EH63_ARATH|nr:unnamed protein product [Arabidopsis thaliana]